MKYSLTYLILLFLMVGFNTKNSEIETATTEKEEQTVLPFTKIDLKDLSVFKTVSKNWGLVGNVNVDRSKKGTFVSEKGTGILLNSPKKNKKGHLFTAFEHGDMELELDVMMPVGSNSGLYFQGRYEVQLLDSWGVEEPQHSDIGGIYQRWDDSRVEKGYEGIAPIINASKAPGLWQHFKIVFQAPKFDASGSKIQNALFKEVRLNGALLHKDQEVTGPTRSSAFNDEKALGTLMIQGDHGAVAFRNVQYRHGLPTLISDENEKKKTTPIEIEVSNETVMQRGFLMHKDVKKTHCISVGTTNKVNYSYDLANGSLLQVWRGKFLDVTKMWYGRGGEQLGSPIGTPILFSGNPAIAILENENSVWPDAIIDADNYKQLGYELDNDGNPSFLTELHGSLIRSSFIPLDDSRGLRKVISVEAKATIWHKIAEGSTIEKLSNNSYLIDDKNYFVELSEANQQELAIRTSEGKKELLVKIPVGKKEINYTIIW